jgi:hypothetical protein
VLGRARPSLVGLMGAALLLSACSSTVAGAAYPLGGGPLTQPVLNYGYGALPAGQVPYQPDVVVVAGGPGAVRSVSSDGMTWTIDAGAGGASDLAVGRIMLLTSQAAGRVVELHDEGDTRVVRLAPVDLPEVISDGTIDVDQAVDSGSMVYQQIPDQPGALSEPGPDDSSIPLPQAAGGGSATGGSGTGGSGSSGSGTGGSGTEPGPDGAAGQATPEPTTPEPSTPDAVIPSAAPAVLLLPAAGPSQPKALPPATKESVTIPVGDWTVTPSNGAGKLGLGIQYKANASLKVGIDMAFTTKDLHIRGVDKIVGGQRVGSGFSITGITGLQISIAAGAANGSLDNSKVKVEVPVEINFPIPPSPATAGLPLNLKFSFKFIVETALTGKNSTLLASGQYALDGPIGIADGTISTPKFTVVSSIIDSLSGITLGPSGVVAAVGLKGMIGLGTPALSAGPFTSLTAAVGVTNGSSLGAPLARCRGATLDLKGGGGAGIAISSSVVPILRGFLPPGTKLNIGTETSTIILHREQVVPDVPLCRT